MKAVVTYVFNTDGDYSLKEPEKFGCISADDYCYMGRKEWEASDWHGSAGEAKYFLQELLCDGLHVVSTHYWVLKWFCEMIERFDENIHYNDTGVWVERLSGNYEGTYIEVAIIE